jgi:hypothetical protein
VYQLRRANHEELLNEIPILPATFEDAIVATRKLGARYIWIDSFCILQDDPTDWEKESSRMVDVYQNALCNIAATASGDTNGGLFYERPDILSGIIVGESESRMILIKDFREMFVELECAPLQKVCGISILNLSIVHR